MVFTSQSAVEEYVNAISEGWENVSADAFSVKGVDKSDPDNEFW